MSWNDDSWRDSYDEWKLRSPDDEYPESYCDHDEYEIDWEGRAHCCRCFESWWATKEEIAWNDAQEADYNAWCRKQERRERWLRLTLWFRWPIFRLLEKVWPRKAGRVLDDSELPF